MDQHDRFPDLNNQPDDGTWQYNYVIWDGYDWENNFGPVVKSGLLDNTELLYCPLQEDPFHMQATPENPWPTQQILDTRAGYGRRYHVSGKSFAQLTTTVGLFTDLVHLPSVVRTAHKSGLNAAYSDGHGAWVPDPGIFSDNELASPFDTEDNAIMEDIWDAIDRGAR